MQDPKVTIEVSLDRLREIVWWNENLTRLHRVVRNPEDIPELIVEASGPFVERVWPPAPYKHINTVEVWHDTATRLEVDPAVREAVKKVLFRQRDDLSLYAHQGRTLELTGWKAITTGVAPSVTIVTVPTASGKSEAFLIPVLDTCAHSKREEQFRHIPARSPLRALFLYPMKTLAVDQLNRFIRYLHELNTLLQHEGVAPIRIGIWDGDTPQRVGTPGDDDSRGQVVARDDQARGLRCPICENPILYRGNESSGCRNHDLPWLSLTRQAILRRGADLLITNPEAIEFLLAGPKNRQLLTTDQLRYIVVDEAHTWNGVEGSSFGLLLMRLRSRFRKSNPRVILSSATLAEPRRFAAQLLQVEEAEVASVDFESRLKESLHAFQIKRPPVDYSRIPVTSAHDVIAMLLTAHLKANEWDEALQELQSAGFCRGDGAAENAARMGSLLGLLHVTNGRLLLTPAGVKLAEHAVPSSMVGLDLAKAIAELTDHPPFIRDWADRVTESLPELLDLVATFFAERSFAEERTLVAHIAGAQIPESDARDILITLLSMGRVADLLFDKYHVFLKPVAGLVYCDVCKTVHRTECPHRHSVWPLSFCSNCHTPAITVARDGHPQGVTEYLTDLGETSPQCRCNSHRRPSLSEPFMHYQTFASYVISTIPPLLSSRKALVFGDGRGLVDLLVDVTQNLEYSLVADRLIALHTLLNPDASLQEIESFITRLLFQIYLNQTPLKVLRESRGHNDPAGPLLKQLDEATTAEIFALRRWARKGRLFDPALLTFDAIDLARDPLEKVLLHTILGELLTAHRDRVDDQLVPSLPVSRLREKLARYPGLAPLVKQGKFEYYLARLIERYKIAKEQKEGKELLVLPDDAKEHVKLRPAAPVTYCLDCYRGAPVTLDYCPYCGSDQVMKGDRLAAGGHLPNPATDTARWALDHWAQDILGPALQWKARSVQWQGDQARMTDLKEGIDRVVVLSHKAGVPMVLRGAIETGFRDSTPPSVNAVCATPTMEMGIDIGSLDCVVQLGVPPSKSNYMQRVGRTGRKMANPSLIFVVIRNEHAVDGYYFGDLENRFLNRELRPLRVPRAPAGVLATHVMAEVLAALGQVSGDDYAQYYYIGGPGHGGALANLTVEQLFTRIVQANVALLCNDVRKHLDHIRRHLQEVFGHLEAFSADHYLRLIFAGGSAMLPRHLVEFFRRLDDIYAESKAPNLVRSFVEQHVVLPQLLNTLSLSPRFRGGGQAAPISDKDGDNLVIQPVPYALRENAPGDFDPKDGPRRGSLWRLEGRGFQMHYVMVHSPALTADGPPLYVCRNEDCEMPFHPYPGQLSTCPFCGNTLEPIQVYEYAYGVGQRYKAPPFNRIIETHAFVQSHIEEG